MVWLRLGDLNLVTPCKGYTPLAGGCWAKLECGQLGFCSLLYNQVTSEQGAFEWVTTERLSKRRLGSKPIHKSKQAKNPSQKNKKKNKNPKIQAKPRGSFHLDPFHAQGFRTHEVGGGGLFSPRESKGLSYGGRKRNTEFFFCLRPFYGVFTAVDKRPKLLRPRKLWVRAVKTPVVNHWKRTVK